MGTSVSSTSPYLINVTTQRGGGLGTGIRGGMADVFAPPVGGMGTGLLGGGLMGFDQDSGIPSDTVDPSKADKADMTKEEYDELITKTDAIRDGTLSDEAKRDAISEKLTEAGVAHDPNTLDLKSNSDQSGLINKRINITDAAGGEQAAGGSNAAFNQAVQALEDAFGGDASAAAVEQAIAADLAEMTGDTELEGSVDSIASDIEDSTAAGGLKVGDVVVDDRISGDYSYIYDAEQNVFHYTPFDNAGNRIFSGETIDASTVSGWTGTNTGDTASILFNKDGTAYVESQAETKNGEETGKIDITFNTNNVAGADVSSVITDTTGGTSDLDVKGSLGTIGDVVGAVTGVTTIGDTTNTTTIGDTTNVTTTIDGMDRKDGLDRRDRTDGVNGRDGLDGRDGTDGADGSDGEDGEKGERGERGLPGVAPLSAPVSNAIFGDQFVFEDVIKPEFLGLLNLRGRR